MTAPNDRGCSAGGRRFPARPLLGVGAVLLGPGLDRVLLVQRAGEPSAGRWTFPGGLVEVGESLRQACRREIAEETGLGVDPRDLCTIAERILCEPEGTRVEYHFVILDFWAVIEEQEPRPASDAAAARWVPVAEVLDLPHTSGVPETIQRARALARGEPRGSLLGG